MINDLKIQRTILEMPSVFTLPELYNKRGISEYGDASERAHVLEILDELMNTLLVEFADLDDESIVAYRSVLAAEYEEETTKNVGKDYAACDQFVCEKCGSELQDWIRIGRDDDGTGMCAYDYIFKYCPNCGREIRED